MSNLIITIISIALVAVAALVGVYYGGQAFHSSQAKGRANALVSQVQQYLAAANLYLLDNNLEDISYAKPCSLMNSRYLQNALMPPFFGIESGKWGCNDTTGRISPSGGYAVWGGIATYFEMYPVLLTNGTANGGGAAIYAEVQGAGDWRSASVANDPLVAACVALNSQTTFSANYTIQASGLPKRNSYVSINAYYMRGNGHVSAWDTGISQVNTCEIWYHDNGKLKILLR